MWSLGFSVQSRKPWQSPSLVSAVLLQLKQGSSVSALPRVSKNILQRMLVFFGPDQPSGWGHLVSNTDTSLRKGYNSLHVPNNFT